MVRRRSYYCGVVFEMGSVRIEVVGPMTSRNLTFAVDAIDRCHEGLYLLDVLIAELQDDRFGVPPPWWFGRWHGLLDSIRSAGNTSAFMPVDYQLVVSAAEFGSPGWLEFVGALNPLTQIRDYLGERHERKKDLNYRNRREDEALALGNDRTSLDNERIHLENELIRNTVLRERMDLLESVGVPEPERNRVLRELVGDPFKRLSVAQDSGVLELPEGRNDAG